MTTPTPPLDPQQTPDVQRAELAALRDAGILTDQEYADATARVEQGITKTTADAVAQTTNVSPADAQATIDAMKTAPAAAMPTAAGDVAQDDALIRDLEAERQADLDQAAQAGHNAEPSVVYDPALAAAAVTCPHCGMAVPGAVLADGPPAPTTTQEVTQ